MPDNSDLSPKQVAAILGVSHQTVLEMIREGRLPAYTVGKGREYRIRREDLEALRAGKDAIKGES